MFELSNYSVCFPRTSPFWLKMKKAYSKRKSIKQVETVHDEYPQRSWMMSFVHDGLPVGQGKTDWIYFRIGLCLTDSVTILPASNLHDHDSRATYRFVPDMTFVGCPFVWLNPKVSNGYMYKLVLIYTRSPAPFYVWSTIFAVIEASTAVRLEEFEFSCLNNNDF
jgi:hypothetical protein